MVGENFCPVGFSNAAGQLLPINSNQALFSLIGCTYGGDCRTTMALPDLRGRSPMGIDANHRLGQRGGQERHTMTVAEMPSHNHTLNGAARPATRGNPMGSDIAEFDAGSAPAYTSGPISGSMAAGVVSNTGGSQSFPIRTPYTVVNWCIAVQGIYPSRN
jgi:microcystin-dependent protein